MSQDDPTGVRETAPRTPAQERFAWYGDPILLLTVPAVFLLDQGTKYLAKSLLSYGQSWPEDSPFRFTHVTNSGTAFGLFTNATPLLIVASIVAIGFLVYFYRTHGAPLPLLRFAIGAAARRGLRKPYRQADQRGRGRLHRPRLVARLQPGRLLDRGRHIHPRRVPGLLGPVFGSAPSAGAGRARRR